MRQTEESIRRSMDKLKTAQPFVWEALELKKRLALWQAQTSGLNILQLVSALAQCCLITCMRQPYLFSKLALPLSTLFFAFVLLLSLVLLRTAQIVVRSRAPFSTLMPLFRRSGSFTRATSHPPRVR